MNFKSLLKTSARATASAVLFSGAALAQLGGGMPSSPEEIIDTAIETAEKLDSKGTADAKKEACDALKKVPSSALNAAPDDLKSKFNKVKSKVCN